MQIPETEIIVTKDGAEILRKTVRPGDYVIGREPGCEVHLDVELVSRRHAQLTVNFDHALIEDLGSSNGTFVNGQRVTEPTRLWPNQKIQIGSATVELHRVKAVSPPDVSLAPQTAAMQRLLPEEFLRDKKYDIGKIVAQGGMGAILDAREAGIQRRVAMKVMLDSSSPDDLSRFIAEARITGQLEHPNVIPVHELGIDENGQPFYTMKMVRGITLRKVLELLANDVTETVKKYPLPALLTIFQKVCDALAFAHSKGVIHRDLKPENIMLDDFGVVLVMDWGLAKVLSQKDAPAGDVTRSAVQTLPPEASGATLSGTIMGTPQYMSPEQARGEIETLDVRSDIYALGAILYHILALRPPVTGRTAMEVVGKVAEGHVEPLSAPKDRNLPDSLVAVVRKAMAFDRGGRYPRVEDLQRDLTAYQTGFATSAENAGLGKQVILALKRHKAVSTSIAAALVVLAAVVAGSTIKVIGERDHAEREASRANSTLAELKKTAPTLLALGESESAAQRFDRALEKLDAAIALDSNLTEAYWQRAWILLGQQRWTDATTAIRLAHDRDPAPNDVASLLQAVEQLAAAHSDAERWQSEAARAVFRQLNAVGATGPVFAFTSKLKVKTEERFKLVEQRVRGAFGKEGVSIQAQNGLVLAKMTNLPIRSLEPLRGLPIDEIIFMGTLIDSLEPLRGMRLSKLEIDKASIADLEPLRGMPLQVLVISTTHVRNIAPLAGMPLRKLNLSDLKGLDLSVLRGMPLAELDLGNTDTIDLTPPRGLRLIKLGLAGNYHLMDLSLLAGVRLEYLDLSGAAVRDISVIRGMPLGFLSLGTTRVTDLAPLQGMPLESLNLKQAHELNDLSPLRGLPIKDLSIGDNPKLRDFSPILDLPQLRQLEMGDFPEQLLPLRQHPSLQLIRADAYPGERNASFRTPADFWKTYDEHNKKVGKQ
jgi:serine/threonine protein kinase